MPNLYITEQNAWIRKTSDRLVLEKDGSVLMEIPCLKLDAVLIYGNVQFTTQAVAEMLDHGIELALFTRSGRLRGQLTPPFPKNIELRRDQYERSRSEDFCLELAREIVQAKIENSAAVLRRFRRNHPETFDPEPVAELDRHAASAAEAPSLDSLRGVEGTAAARYFSLLGRAFPEDFEFDGRNRRPPRDPVNALLSFGYVIVGNELQALLDGIGFDPYLGFYHQVDYGRPSLALDLLEELRPALVDRFTLSVLNLGTLKPEHFVGGGRKGVYLGREGKKAYFAAFEGEMERKLSLGDEELSMRQVLRRQAHRLARALQAEEPYRAFRLPD